MTPQADKSMSLHVDKENMQVEESHNETIMIDTNKPRFNGCQTPSAKTSGVYNSPYEIQMQESELFDEN